MHYKRKNFVFYCIVLLYCRVGRAGDLSIMVMLMTFNHSDVGSNPIGPTNNSHSMVGLPSSTRIMRVRVPPVVYKY
jgi:hypothetical protein